MEEEYVEGPCAECGGGGLKWFERFQDVDCCDVCGGCGVV